ncbi:MAG: hypothetical protein E7508_10775 [Ruminococcus sp.]|nr:hypothetical protein [Ruminococcus sp.]
MKDVYEDFDIGFKAVSEYDPKPQKPPIPPQKILVPIIAIIGSIIAIIGIYFLAKYIGNHFEEMQTFIKEAFTTTDENGEEIPLKVQMISVLKTLLPLTISLIGIKTATKFLYSTIKGA